MLTPLPSSRARYIFRGGRARRWPLGAAETIAAIARVGTSFARKQTRPRDGETVASWADRVAGRAARTWLISPALQGVYAAPPEHLSASLIFGRRRTKSRSVAPAGGMGQLMTSLRQKLEARGVAFRLGARVDTLNADRPTIICTGARAASALIAPQAPSVAAAIAAIRTTGLVTATAFFDSSDDDVHGFGVLFPRAEQSVTALGVLFNADIFSGRSAHRSETWIYAESDVAALSDGSLTQQIVSDRRLLTRRSDAPREIAVTRWANAIPVYDEAVARARDACGDLPRWLRVTGNYLGELGVAALIARARAAADAL